MAAEAQVRGWSGPSRRRVPRFPMQSPLDVTVRRSEAQETVPGRSVNVCERGISAALAGELIPGEEVDIKVEMPQASDALRTRAVVRYQDKLRCGLEFIGLSAAQRAAIRDSMKEAKEAKTGPEQESRPKRSAGRRSGDGIGPGLRKPPAAASSAKASSAPPSSDLKPDSAAPSALALSASGSAKPASPVTSLSSSSAAAATSGSSSSRGRGFIPVKRPMWRAADVVIGALIMLTIIAGIFWWKWNQGWEELESGLKNNNAAALAKPQAQVATEVMEKLLVHRVQPTYPAEARNDNLQGIIALEIVVGRDGSVIRMHALNGPDVLARAAMDALRWWRFEPYRVNGEPAIVETTMAVEFKR
jgi:TonB family protein